MSLPSRDLLLHSRRNCPPYNKAHLSLIQYWISPQLVRNKTINCCSRLFFFRSPFTRHFCVQAIIIRIKPLLFVSPVELTRVAVFREIPERWASESFHRLPFPSTRRDFLNFTLKVWVRTYLTNLSAVRVFLYLSANSPLSSKQGTRSSIICKTVVKLGRFAVCAFSRYDFRSQSKLTRLRRGLAIRAAPEGALCSNLMLFVSFGARSLLRRP